MHPFKSLSPTNKKKKISPRPPPENREPFDLICMDIMMPNIDGLQALKEIREIEKDMDISGSERVKVIMTTVLDNPKTIFDAIYRGEADAYVFKPVSRQQLLEEMHKLNLLDKED